jgi:serine/threonine-protein kinase
MDTVAIGQTVDARLATLSPDEVATLARNPRSTIVPPDRAADSRQERALGVLIDLSAGRAQPLSVGRTIGEGGMGIVHLARQESMGRDVAVKTLRAEYCDETSAMRLLREAWVTGSLEHPNVVPVYDVAVDAAGAPQVVLKRIDGVDWASLLRDKTALRERADGDVEAWNLRTLMQVCNAVDFAHDRGILHRDLKPENVMIGTFGEVYVVDWGIAVSLRQDADPRLPRVSAATDLAGTPAYMAPEMLTGIPARLGIPTDVFLLGAILFEIFAGRPPHEGSRLEEIFTSVLASPPEIPLTVPGEIADICRRAMAADPADRYASVAEFRRAIGEYLEHREAMRLTHQAQRRLNELLEEIAEAGGGGSETAGSVHHLFGECRFGFRAALDAWPENEVARGALRLAIKAMAEYEISVKNLAAARLLVGELGDPPQELRRRLAELERERALDAEHRERLEALRRDYDPTTGSRTRTFVAAVLGVTWTFLPVVLHFYLRATDRTPNLKFSFAVAGGSLVLALGLGYWGRESMMKTVVNRRMFAFLIFVLVAHLVFDTVMAIAGIGGLTAMVMNFFLWFTAAGIAAITIEPRAWPTAVGYLAALFLSLIWPEYLLLFAGASQAVLTINVIAIWSPMGWGSRSQAPAPRP